MTAPRLRMQGEFLSQMENALRTFQESGAKFRILKSVHPSSPTSIHPQRPPADESPTTLFILDSSFNPPSVAHRLLAQSVLEKSHADRFPGPYRLLLLFSTMNADKAPSAASFPQRLAMMTILAEDIMDDLLHSVKTPHYAVPIDIGVTTAPYYTDKSLAIEAEGSEWYPLKPKHVHLVGFDTLTRIFGAKYYPKSHPPFSALNPYFEDGGHRLRVTLRPNGEHGNVEDQHAFLSDLSSGKMELDGAKREWADQIELVPPHPQTGVSSTRIRKAASTGSWEEVKQICSSRILHWLQNNRLYDDD